MEQIRVKKITTTGGETHEREMNIPADVFERLLKSNSESNVNYVRVKREPAKAKETVIIPLKETKEVELIKESVEQSSGEMSKGKYKMRPNFIDDEEITKEVKKVAPKKKKPIKRKR